MAARAKAATETNGTGPDSWLQKRQLFEDRFDRLFAGQTELAQKMDENAEIRDRKIDELRRESETRHHELTTALKALSDQMAAVKWGWRGVAKVGAIGAGFLAVLGGIVALVDRVVTWLSRMAH